MASIEERAQTTLVTKDRGPGNGKLRGILIVTSGAEAGAVFTIPEREIVTIGRNESCRYRFRDGSVSGNHAQLVYIADDFSLRDNGSTNGTFVNDVRICEVTVLRDGDRIRLGPNVALRFSLVDEHEESALRTMHEAATSDALTGLYNRRHFDTRLDSELRFALRHGTELALAIFDVDRFKRINDTRGHLVGDQVLKGVAAAMSAGIRAEDFVARYGGEEFVVIVRSIALPGAIVMADRLRARVERDPIVVEGGSFPVTVSAGVATLSCLDPGATGERDAASLLALADRRLYRAKAEGRNRVSGGAGDSFANGGDRR